MLNAFVEQVPVEGLAEFAAIVGLDSSDLERQLREHKIDEADRGSLIMRRVGAEHSQAHAVIERDVLVSALLPSGLLEKLDELHIDL